MGVGVTDEEYGKLRKRIDELEALLRDAKAAGDELKEASLQRIAELEAQVERLNHKRHLEIKEAGEYIKRIAELERGHSPDCDTKDAMIPGKPCNCFVWQCERIAELEGVIRNLLIDIDAQPRIQKGQVDFRFDASEIEEFRAKLGTGGGE